MELSDDAAAALERDAERAREDWQRLRDAVASVFLGQEQVVEEVLLGLLAGGHVLLQGVPGLGKTTLVRSLAAALDLSFQRLQCTPDLLPADVLGTRVLEESPDGRRSFAFHPGPVFAHVLLVDEINRATPRTQSALLEAMQEHAVTLYGETRRLEAPFAVLATQNPIEMEGTYPLPEAQLDRFLLQVDVALPERAELVRVLEARAPDDAPAAKPVLDRRGVLDLQRLTRAVPASRDVVERVARLVLATHPEGAEAPPLARRFVRWGASPRGGQALLAAARARALVRGRAHVADEDLEAMSAPALRHRLILGYEAEAEGVRPDDVVAEVLSAVRT